jgi:hypothetical protein
LITISDYLRFSDSFSSRRYWSRNRSRGASREAVKVAVELGNDVDGVDKCGNTATHGAAFKWAASVRALPDGKGREDRNLELEESPGLDATADRRRRASRHEFSQFAQDR